MLEEILMHLRNWFPVQIHTGEFQIENGSITLPFLMPGQYFRIIGSVFNDGLHTEGDILLDETFEGAVWALAIPPALIAIAKEIEEWEEKYHGAGPYVSETTKSYSYTKAVNSNGQPVTWQDAFRVRLNKWRKI